MHPGLINAHTHSPGNLGKGMGDLWSLELLLTASQWIGSGRTLEDKYLSATIGAAEMVMKGCTAAYDLAAEFPLPSVDGLSAMAKAYEEVGMRAVLAPMVADTTFFEAIPGLMERLSPSLQKEVESFRYAPWKAITKQMNKALQKWPFEKVTLAVAPTIPHHCSDDFLIACRNLAREYEVGIHSHVAELKVQVVAGYKRYGTSLAAHMDELGLVNERFTVAHGVWLDGEDMKRLGDRGASVAHNPGSNMRLGNGLADMRAMLRADINVGIGTDGANCSDNQNMYEAMRHASFSSKVQGPDVERWITTAEVLRAATEGSARALGLAQADRPHRAGLQGRHRLPRPAPHQLDPDQRSGERPGPHRGRHRRALGHDRRTHGGRGPQAPDRRSRQARGQGRRVTRAAREDHRAGEEALRPAGEGRRHVLPRPRQGAAAHPSLRRQPSPSLVRGRTAAAGRPSSGRSAAVTAVRRTSAASPTSFGPALCASHFCETPLLGRATSGQLR